MVETTPSNPVTLFDNASITTITAFKNYMNFEDSDVLILEDTANKYVQAEAGGSSILLLQDTITLIKARSYKCNKRVYFLGLNGFSNYVTVMTVGEKTSKNSFSGV